MTTTTTEYTVTQAAEKLGAGVSTVRKHAAAMELPRLGRNYRLTDAHIERIRAALADETRPGRRVADLDSAQRPLPRRRGLDAPADVAPVRKPRARKGGIAPSLFTGSGQAAAADLLALSGEILSASPECPAVRR